MNLKDLLSPALAGDKRVQSTTPTLRRVFVGEYYEVFVCLYPGLLTCLIYYKKEALRVMIPLWEDGATGGLAARPAEARLQAAVDRLKRDGRGPMNLVMDAKLECGLLLSLYDRAALKLAGVNVPRSAGRYKDMFL
jgi:hypothetical protein